MEKFIVEKEINNIVSFIRDYYKQYNLGGAVLGISGGKDSGVVAALLVKALGSENVVGLTLPCHSDISDKNDAKLVSDYYNFELINFDLTNVFDSFKDNINKIYPNLSEEKISDSDINLKPRLRMTSVYYFAALLSKLKNKPYLVIGTSNKCELFVGYFTKGGDSVHDIAVIADLTVEEVIKVGEYLKVPKEVLYKTPNDGLSNLTDEDKLGVKYKAIEAYLKDPNSVEKEVREKIEKMNRNSRHKFNIPSYEK